MTLARYLVAAVSARLADEGARVAIVLLTLERTHDAGLGGLLVAALMVPHVLAAPLVGAAADRVRRRKMLYVSAFIWYGLALAVTPLLVGTSEWAAAGLLVTAGCLSPLLLGASAACSVSWSRRTGIARSAWTPAPTAPRGSPARRWPR